MAGKEGIKKLKLFPSPHVEVTVHVSDQMERDIKECWKKENGKECDTCSWRDIKLFGTGMCELEEVISKILGDVKKDEEEHG